jgi:hypothetical protein
VDQLDKSDGLLYRHRRTAPPPVVIMQRCPSDIADLIVDDLIKSYRADLEHDLAPKREYFRTLATCTIVCRVLAGSARPRLFAYVWLKREKQCLALAELVERDPDIAKWIKYLIVTDSHAKQQAVSPKARLLNPDEKPTMRWLCSDIGASFISTLTELRALEFFEFIPSSMSNFNTILDTFRRLDTIVSLQLHNCWSMSLLQMASLIQAFPRLSHISIGEFGEDLRSAVGSSPETGKPRCTHMMSQIMRPFTDAMSIPTLTSIHKLHVQLLIGSYEKDELIDKYHHVLEMLSPHVVRCTLKYDHDLSRIEGGTKYTDGLADDDPNYVYVPPPPKVLTISSMPLLESLEIHDTLWPLHWGDLKHIPSIVHIPALRELQLKIRLTSSLGGFRGLPENYLWSRRIFHTSDYYIGNTHEPHQARLKYLDAILSTLGTRLEQDLHVHVHLVSWLPPLTDLDMPAWEEAITEALPRASSCPSLILTYHRCNDQYPRSRSKTHGPVGKLIYPLTSTSTSALPTSQLPGPAGWFSYLHRVIMAKALIYLRAIVSYVPWIS